MTKITENHIEQSAIKLLQKQGYQHIDTPQRNNEDVLLIDTLQAAIARINPSIPIAARDDTFKQIQQINSPDLITNNEAFHRLLTEGVPVSYTQEGNDRGDRVWLVDFNNPDNNEFSIINQFTVVENGINKRPDMVLFINGLPLIVIELKNPTDENATIKSAYQQLQTYKERIPSLFITNAILVISDGLEAKAGSLSADLSRFMAWKSADGIMLASHLVSQLETLINGMLNKASLLDLIRHFIVFEKSKTQDAKTDITSIRTIKKLAAYHQYYAVNKAVESTLRATAINTDVLIKDDPINYGLPTVKNQPKGDRKGGVIWHTQSSGKSLSMVFYAGKIVQLLANPTILVITDRNDLDDQLFDTFAASKQLLRQEPIQANDRQHLKKLLKVASGGVVFTTIQKFQPDKGNVYETLSERQNIVVIADEAHRTQYGFQAKTIDDKDAQHNVIGKKVVYGFAKYMRDALPNATYLGFTGTPIENTDINTPAVFGSYVDIYDISQAVESKYNKLIPLISSLIMRLFIVY
jgi:type I restriction enzyme R subunit